MQSPRMWAAVAVTLVAVVVVAVAGVPVDERPWLTDPAIRDDPNTAAAALLVSCRSDFRV